MEILPATVEDAEAILTLQRVAYQSEAAIYDDFTIPPLTETLDDLEALLATERVLFLKAVEDGRIVGSVRAFVEAATCHIERLIVHPDYRCRGFGKALLKQIEGRFPAARRFELFTGHKSTANIRLYQRLGYRAFRQQRANEKVTLVYLEKTVRLREFQPGDEAGFRRLNEEWLTKYFSVEPKDRELFADPHQKIIASGGAIFILELGGEPVGCCALMTKDAETLEVAKMAVTEAHQGKGFGRMLLEACIEKAQSLGKKRLFIETNSQLAAAIALYRKLGFVDLSPGPSASPQYARGDLLMELKL